MSQAGNTTPSAVPLMMTFMAWLSLDHDAAITILRAYTPLFNSTSLSLSSSIMKIVDSACFDPRLLREGLEPVVPFHVANPNDPGTKLLVDGTTSTFDFMGQLYLALRRDSRSVIPLHDFHMEVARREVAHLENLWQTVIHNAKQTLNTLEERYAQRMAEEQKSENTIHLSLPNTLTPGKPNTWHYKLAGSLKGAVVQTKKHRLVLPKKRKTKSQRVKREVKTESPGPCEIDTIITYFDGSD